MRQVNSIFWLLNVVRKRLLLLYCLSALDESVQAQFESYLEERGIATDLALFIPNFAEFKEQRGTYDEHILSIAHTSIEYCSWLENVKKFVDA